jgi:hypothetical protein
MWRQVVSRPEPRIALLAAMVGLVFVVGLPACTTSGGQAAEAQRSTSPPTSLAGELLSRGVPAFSSSDQATAANANDADYSTTWRAKPPCWLAYDLSGVPEASRKSVIVAWYNDATGAYDHTLLNGPAYNLPRDYTIAISNGAGDHPPQSGWTEVARVSDNHLHSRQHVVDLMGERWLRILITAVDGSPLNDDAALNLDVVQAGQPLDDWLFAGDSITSDGMLHGTPSFPALVEAQVPGKYPVEEDAGIGGFTAADGEVHLPVWLANFPGHYVSLAFGTNDASNMTPPLRFRSEYEAMVAAVEAAGKIAVVPKIPAGCTQALVERVPSLNAEIEQLWTAHPEVVHGPDFEAYFTANRLLLSADCIHPSTPYGMTAYRVEYARVMVEAIFRTPA